ncbi:CNH domain-containing protein [Trichoderma velutinum]
MIQDDIQRPNDEPVESRPTISLETIRQVLQSRTSEIVDLKLDEDGRELLFVGELKASLNDTSNVTVLLFDHAILLANLSWNQNNVKIKTYRRPIPLELLLLSKTKQEDTHKSLLRPLSFFGFMKASSTNTMSKEAWPITFCHLGKTGYELTLYATCEADQEKWMGLISAAHERLRVHPEIFNPDTILINSFANSGKINCAVPLDHGRKLLYGTDNGIYLSNREKRDSIPEKVLDVQKITQIDILEECNLLLILSNNTLRSYPLVHLDSDNFSILQNSKTLQTRCTFFKAGVCMGKHMVSCVKSSSLSTTIKIFETNHTAVSPESMDGDHHELELFKEFYLPKQTFSVHFMKSKICVASRQGFEVVSLETLETQMLLDETDASIQFALSKGPRPIHMQRVHEEFLLNYTEFSFFVDRNGKRSRPQWQLDWSGSPQSFALSFPWIFAFESKFIELRNIETGAIHVMPYRNIRMLHCSSHEILFTYENDMSQDVIESIGLERGGAEI